MARIGDIFSNESGKSLPNPTGPSAGRGASKADFARQYEASQAAQEASTFEEMVLGVDRHAQMLLRSPTPSSVAAYREAVRRYLKEVNDKLGRVDKRTDRRNRTLVLLKELDEHLAALTEAILKGQAEAVDLAATINEIRGMLLDLLI